MTALVWTVYLVPLEQMYANYSIPMVMYAEMEVYQSMVTTPMFVLATLLLGMAVALAVYGVVMLRMVEAMGTDPLRLGTVRRNVGIFVVIAVMFGLQFAFAMMDLQISNYFDPTVSLLGKGKKTAVHACNFFLL